MSARLRRLVALALGLLASRVVAPSWCGRDAAALYRGDPALQDALAAEMVAFEARDDARHDPETGQSRYAGEWALVTHQMVALGLAQICRARPERCPSLIPTITDAAKKTFLPEMRDFGTRAWDGEDALDSLEREHGHAYFAYPALAVGVARALDPAFPADLARTHDALITAFERRLTASSTGLIETYPGQSFPTDVAAVAAAIAVHGRATGADHRAVLDHWAEAVRRVQVDPKSGLVWQRMDAHDGQPLDAPRGSGTGLAAYFAGFADSRVEDLLAEGLFRQEAGFWGFGGIREYAPGYDGDGDVDSGPVVLGISVSATGFALGPARALGRESSFEHIYRTTELFGVLLRQGGRARYATGGPIGDALLLALLTSGPERAP